MKVETYKIKGWKKKERGLVISENKDWILVKYIPVDYAIDGFKLYSKKYVKSRKSKSKEQQIERVLNLKNITKTKPDDFEFGNTIDILTWLENKFGLFEFQDDSEDELFYGKINSIKKNSLIIDMVKANGIIEREYDYIFKIDKIRTITFKSDYFESIRLLMEDELKKKTSDNNTSTP